VDTNCEPGSPTKLFRDRDRLARVLNPSGDHHDGSLGRWRAGLSSWPTSVPSFDRGNRPPPPTTSPVPRGSPRWWACPLVEGRPEQGGAPSGSVFAAPRPRDCRPQLFETGAPPRGAIVIPTALVPRRAYPGASGAEATWFRPLPRRFRVKMKPMMDETGAARGAGTAPRRRPGPSSPRVFPEPSALTESGLDEMVAGADRSLRGAALVFPRIFRMSRCAFVVPGRRDEARDRAPRALAATHPADRIGFPYRPYGEGRRRHGKGGWASSCPPHERPPHRRRFSEVVHRGASVASTGPHQRAGSSAYVRGRAGGVPNSRESGACCRPARERLRAATAAVSEETRGEMAAGARRACHRRRSGGCRRRANRGARRPANAGEAGRTVVLSGSRRKVLLGW